MMREERERVCVGDGTQMSVVLLEGFVAGQKKKKSEKKKLADEYLLTSYGSQSEKRIRSPPSCWLANPTCLYVPVVMYLELPRYPPSPS